MAFKHWEDILFPGTTLPTMKLFFLLTSLYLRWKLVEISGFVGNRSKEVKLFSRSGWNHCATSREQTSPCLWARETWVLMSEQKGNTSGIPRHGSLKVKYTVGLELPVLSMLHGKRLALACGARWQCRELTLNLIFSWHLGGYYTVWFSQQSRWCLCPTGKGSYHQSVTVPTEILFFSPNVF